MTPSVFVKEVPWLGLLGHGMSSCVAPSGIGFVRNGDAFLLDPKHGNPHASDGFSPDSFDLLNAVLHVRFRGERPLRVKLLPEGRHLERDVLVLFGEEGAYFVVKDFREEIVVILVAPADMPSWEIFFRFVRAIQAPDVNRPVLQQLRDGVQELRDRHRLPDAIALAVRQREQGSPAIHEAVFSLVLLRGTDADCVVQEAFQAQKEPRDRFGDPPVRARGFSFAPLCRERFLKLPGKVTVGHLASEPASVPEHGLCELRSLSLGFRKILFVNVLGQQLEPEKPRVAGVAVGKLFAGVEREALRSEVLPQRRVCPHPTPCDPVAVRPDVRLGGLLHFPRFERVLRRVEVVDPEDAVLAGKRSSLQ